MAREVERMQRVSNFEFHGHLGKRRVVSLIWRYEFYDRDLQKAFDIPRFLTPLRDRAAAFAGIGVDELRYSITC
jgi:hypothetical protein